MTLNNSNNNSFQLIRNATFLIKLNGKKILIDPMLAEKGRYEGFEGTINSHFRNPMVELPVPVESLLDFDAIIVTHTHPDHWDEVAIKLLPKDKPLYSQNESDAKLIRNVGFTNVIVLNENGPTKFTDDIEFHKTSCQHGSDEAYANPQLAEILGEVTGIVFTSLSNNFKNIYIVGDTIWTNGINSTIEKYKPHTVIGNFGFAQLIGFGAIIMGKEDVGRFSSILPNDSTIIAAHLEAINHCVLSRNELSTYITENNIKNAIIPNDGDIIKLI